MFYSKGKEKREDSLDGKSISSTLAVSPTKTNKNTNNFLFRPDSLVSPSSTADKPREDLLAEKEKEFTNFILNLYNLGNEKDTETTGTATVKRKETEKFVINFFINLSIYIAFCAYFFHVFIY